MGSSQPDIVVFIYTGQIKDAGTINTVHLVLHGENGNTSKPVALNTSLFSNDFKSGQLVTLQLSPKNVEQFHRSEKIQSVELWKDDTLFFISDDWFMDKIVVENCATNVAFVFPFFRWIKNGHRYHIKHLDTSLPQFYEHSEQRRKELEEKKKIYEYYQKIPDGPVQVKNLPSDENFSLEYSIEFGKSSFSASIKSKHASRHTDQFKSIEDIENVYNVKAFQKPKAADTWKTDHKFGRQRLESPNPVLITLLKAIPDKFPITDILLGPLLEGLTLKDAIASKRLFFTDLSILEDTPTTKGLELCKPIALFFVDKNKDLMPIAIQLYQEPGPDNPIFTPLDRPMTWTFVKMWYDNAEAAHHQSLAHLGFTHLLMEGCTIATQRNLSPSHPIFKILAPHFLFLIAINKTGLEVLFAEEGWINSVMNIGTKGMKALIVKGFDCWRLGVEGLLSEDLKARGVDDPEVLPGYYFRDDAIMLFNAIKTYAQSYVDLYYTSKEMLKQDEELQSWAHELVKPKDGANGGVGLKGVPGDGQITLPEELVSIITCMIYTCSVAHASVNFSQYDEYGYPPNYPSLMKGKPPTSKDATITEQDLLNSLADKNETFDIMSMVTVLSNKGTNSLGDFEVQYIFDPKALRLVEQFRVDLKEISRKVKSRNTEANSSYDYLDPENIPNSISI